MCQQDYRDTSWIEGVVAEHAKKLSEQAEVDRKRLTSGLPICMCERCSPMEPVNNKDKAARDRAPLHLIPGAAEIEESYVMKLGADKYGAFNWRDAEVIASVYISAARRHLMQWFDGEDIDGESGYSHLAHARACLGILLDAESLGKLKDDRPRPGKATALLSKFKVQPGSGDGDFDPDGGTDDISLSSVHRPAVASDELD